jgi:hypothetical protein
MNIYRISQNANNDWDTYDAAIVTAPDIETARRMHPRTGKPWRVGQHHYDWAHHHDEVTALLLGTYTGPNDDKPYVLLASFRAG